MRNGADQLHLHLGAGGQQLHPRRRFRFWACVLALTILLLLLA